MSDRHSLEDVLTDFATLDGDPEARLDAFLLRFPEFENELMELAAELAFDAADDATECGPVDERLAAASRRGLAEAEDRLAGRPAAPEGADPFAGRTLRSVAAALGCSALLLARLRDRVVRSEEMSAGFVAALARALSASVEDVAAYVALPPRMPAGGSYSHDGKQGFQEALESSGLSDEQKRRLSSL